MFVPPSPMPRPGQRALFGAILLAAVTARIWNISAGVPHAVGIDEPQVIDRALRILNTGDWNTHLFDYPPLVIYFHAWVAIACYLWGAINGAWGALSTFDIRAVYVWGRTAAALVGVATVWLTYRLGRELRSRRTGLLAAALLTVHPAAVRESHFILTDVPVTALTTAALVLALRAARVHTAAAYAWAGAAVGLAAAAKYNGAVAIVPLAIAWLVFELFAADRWRKAIAALGGTAVAFAMAAPYSVLDLPAFLNGFAAQLARFSTPRQSMTPAWEAYLKHLSLPARYWVPMAVAGMLVVLWRHEERRRWLPPIAFALAYFYVLASHPLVFARYALPLGPVLSLLVAAAVLQPVDLARRWPPLSGAVAYRALLGAAVVLLTAGFVVQITSWTRQFGKPDTRTIATDWLKQQAPKGATVAVENSGPTYLNAAGFKVIGTELLLDHPPDWYAGRVQYLVISAADLTRYADYIAGGRVVYRIAPAPTRWGPGIVVVKLT